jgi:phage gpG-like protein
VLGVKFTLDRDGSLLRDIADRARELRPVLRQWGAYLRAGGKAKIAAGDFAPWAASTMAKYAATGTAAVTKQGKVRSSVAKKLDQALRRSGNEDARQALRTLLAGGTPTTSNRAVNRLRRRLDAAKKKLDSGGEVNVGKRKIERTKLLGKLANAFSARLQSAAVVVENAVKWSKVHNEGGRVGNGTTVPERRFLGISDDARRELADIALRWIVGGKD